MISLLVSDMWQNKISSYLMLFVRRMDEEGSIVRTGVAENKVGEDDAEASVIVPAAELGRGRRVKIGSKRFNAEWEEH